MNKLFATLGLALAVTVTGLHGALAEVDPNIPTTSKYRPETNARIDRDRLSDVQWAGLFTRCQQILGGAGDPADMPYCRAVVRVTFGEDSNNG